MTVFLWLFATICLTSAMQKILCLKCASMRNLQERHLPRFTTAISGYLYRSSLWLVENSGLPEGKYVHANVAPVALTVSSLCYAHLYCCLLSRMSIGWVAIKDPACASGLIRWSLAYALVAKQTLRTERVCPRSISLRSTHGDQSFALHRPEQ